MATLSKETVNSFIIDTVLISPIEKIISQLKNNEFRDCDIKWLDKKLKGFIDFAAETLAINAPIVSKPSDFPYFNPYVQNYYTERFTILLDYFKNLTN